MMRHSILQRLLPITLATSIQRFLTSILVIFLIGLRSPSP